MTVHAIAPIGGNTPRRKQLLGKVHIARKQLALTDDSYRDVIERVTDRRSAAECDDRQLVAVIEEFKRLGWRDARKTPVKGGRPLATGPQAGKARALWLSLWNLGEISDPAESVLAAFVRRQTGKEDLRFCHSGDFNKIVEGLKAMLSRAIEAAGWKVPAGDDAHAWRLAVLRAQWRIFGRVKDDNGLRGYIGLMSWDNNPIDQWPDELLDRCITRLGRDVRHFKAMAKAKES
jgi:phage gp16-like protein